MKKHKTAFKEEPTTTKFEINKNQDHQNYFIWLITTCKIQTEFAKVSKKKK